MTAPIVGVWPHKPLARPDLVAELLADGDARLAVSRLQTRGELWERLAEVQS